jgi:hypothetical protein
MGSFNPGSGKKGEVERILAMGQSGDGGDSTITVTKWAFKAKIIVVLVALLMLLPVWLLSMSVVFSVMKFLSQPVLYGSVPMWMVIAMVILFIVYVNKNR